MLLFFLLVFSLKIGLAQADSDELNLLCQDGNNQNISAASKPHKLILDLMKTVLNPERGSSSYDAFELYFAVSTMSRHILGRTYSNINEKQRQDFAMLFMELNVLRFQPKIKKLFLQSTGNCFNFEGEWTHNQTIILNISFSQQEESDINLSFFITNIDGVFKIYDVKIENIQFLSSKRASYRSIISESGFDELMRKLNDKLKQIKNSQ